jgi:hypothetical protein
MSEMIERIAKVLAKCDAEPEAWPQYTDDAIAAIEAMRTPTKAMAIRAVSECATIDLATDEDFQAVYIDVWESMIDAALNEKGPTPPK